VRSRKNGEGIRFIFLHAKVGQGHTQAAKSLAKEAIKEDSVSEALVIDCLDIVNQTVSKITKTMYIGTIKYLPGLWVSLYKGKSPIMKASHFIARSLMRWALYRYLSRIIRLHRPHAIVCTHFFPIPPLAHLKYRYSPFKLYVVVTDGDLHPLWTYNGVDAYFVADERAISRFSEKNLKARIFPIGMPIDSLFNRPPKENVKVELGFSDRFTVMIVGGGEGIGPIGEIARAVDSSISNINIITLCGRNEKLRKKLTDINFKNQVYIFNYVENIIDLYDASNCIVGKPGGITTSEVFARGKPFVAYLAYGGQEEGNIKRFVGKDGFFIAKNKEEIPRIINEIKGKDDNSQLIKNEISNSDRKTTVKIIEAIINDIIGDYGLL